MPALVHQRKLIRRATVALLVGKTAAGQRVYSTRFKPLRQIELPAVLVYTTDTVTEETSPAPREFTSTVSLIVECLLSLNEGADDAVDDMAAIIEDAIGSDIYLGGTCVGSELKKTELLVSEAGERPMAMAQLTFDVTYRTDIVDSRVTPVPFVTASMTYASPEGIPGDTATVQDVVELAQ